MKKRIVLILLAVCVVFTSMLALMACNFCNHKWKDATCMMPKTCTVCGKTQGNRLPHKFDQKVVHDKYAKFIGNCVMKSVYYYSCKCGLKSGDTFEYLDDLSHRYTTAQYIDENEHILICERNNAHQKNEGHSFNQKITSEEYKANGVDCTAPVNSYAGYYYSCLCGAKGAEKFFVYSTAAHNWGEWTSNGDGTHTRVCKTSAEHTQTLTCHGGQATCMDKAVCDVCGEIYGGFAFHRGGVATCIQKAICDVCGDEYGDFAEHRGGTATCTQQAVCDVCGVEYGILAEHRGGDATCTQQATCDVCGVEYGDFAPHTYDQKVIDDQYLCQPAGCMEEYPATYYYSCICGEKGWEIFKSNIYAEHNWREWRPNEDGTHVRYCLDYAGRYHDETEACYGGQADCAHKAVCEVCNVGYGEVSAVHECNVQIEDKKYLVEGSFGNCVTKPSYYYTCACGKEIGTETFVGRYILHHSVVEDAYVPATFGKTGLTAGSHCELCDFVFAEQKELDALHESYSNYESYQSIVDGHKCYYSYSLKLAENNSFTLQVTVRAYVNGENYDPTVTQENHKGTITYDGSYHFTTYRLDFDEDLKPIYIKFNVYSFDFVNPDGSEWVKDIYDRPVGVTITPVLPRTGNSIYGYNDLANNKNGRAMQTLYRAMYAICEQFVDSSEYIIESDEKYLLENINYANLGLTVDEAVAVWKVFYIENPRYYWLSNTLSFSGEMMNLCIDSEYASATYRRECDMAIDLMVQASNLLIEPDMSELKKALVLHDFIVTYMNYAYEADGTTPKDAIWAHNMIGTAKHKLGVCEAYAKSYLYLCLLNEIECILVTGRTANDGGHAWNLVCIDGVWYGVDCTWDDNGEDWDVRRNYFGMSYLEVASSRTTDAPNGEGIDYLYELPSLGINALRPVHLYKGDDYMGIYGSIDKAFDAMTDDNGVYDIRLLPYPHKNWFTYSMNEYQIFSTQTPKVKQINMHFNRYKYDDGWTFWQTVFLQSDLYLNCDMTFVDASFSGDGSLNLQNYTMYVSQSASFLVPIYGSIDDQYRSRIVLKEDRNGVEFSELSVHSVICEEEKWYSSGLTLKVDSHVVYYEGSSLSINCHQGAEITVDTVKTYKNMPFYLNMEAYKYAEALGLATVNIGEIIVDKSNNLNIHREFVQPEEFVLLNVGKITCDVLNLSMSCHESRGHFDENGDFVVDVTLTYDALEIKEPLITLLDAAGINSFEVDIVEWEGNGGYYRDHTDLYEMNDLGQVVLKQSNTDEQALAA